MKKPILFQLVNREVKRLLALPRVKAGHLLRAEKRLAKIMASLGFASSAIRFAQTVLWDRFESARKGGAK